MSGIAQNMALKLRLPPAECLVLQTIADSANEESLTATLTHKFVAEETGFKLRKVEYAVAELKRRVLVEVLGTSPKGNEYLVRLDHIFAALPPRWVSRFKKWIGSRPDLEPLAPGASPEQTPAPDAAGVAVQPSQPVRDNPAPGAGYPRTDRENPSHSVRPNYKNELPKNEPKNEEGPAPSAGPAPAAHEGEGPVVVELPLAGKADPVFRVRASLVPKMHEAFPALDIAAELLSLREWLAARPREQSTRAGIRKRIFSWLTISQNDPRRRRSARPVPRAPEPSQAEPPRCTCWTPLPPSDEWSAVLATLRASLPREDWEAWGQRMRPVALSPNLIVLGGAPNAFFRSRIEKQHHALVLGAVVQAFPDMGSDARPKLSVRMDEPCAVHPERSQHTGVA